MRPWWFPGRRPQGRVGFAPRRFFVGVAHAQPAAKIQEFQCDAFRAQFLHARRQAAHGAAKGIEAHNLRADVHADSLPTNPLRTAMGKIYSARFSPIETKLVFVASGGNMRRSEEHTSELQSLAYLVCRLLLEKKNQNTNNM